MDGWCSRLQSNEDKTVNGEEERERAMETGCWWGQGSPRAVAPRGWEDLYIYIYTVLFCLQIFELLNYLVSQVVSFPQVSPPKSCIRLSSPIRATCPAHLIFLDFITRTIFGEQYRSLSSSLCSFLHSVVTSGRELLLVDM
jgi:hypothetical protein